MRVAESPVGLALRGLLHYRRSHFLVALATAVAAAVLVGALAVGDSVRGSLRAAFTERLGEADFALLPRHDFEDEPESGLPVRLAARLERDAPGRFDALAPVLRLAGTVFLPDGSPSATTVFGVDERYFALHGLSGEVAAGAVRVGPALAGRGVEPGDSVLVRVEGVSGIASASFFGDKGDSAITVRRTVEAWADPAPGPASGGFSLFPVQGPVRAVFLRLDELRGLLDADPGGPPRANALLVRRSRASAPDPEADRAALADALEAVATLDDRGLGLRRGASDDLVLESRSLALSDGVVEGAGRAAAGQGLESGPVLTWLATNIAANGRETPYSLVAGLPAGWFPPGAASDDSLIPGPWLAEDLGLSPGDHVELSWLTWDEAGRFHAGSGSFRSEVGVALAGVFGDASLSPEYPGVTDSARMGDWDPPFPVDLDRIRDRDEAYWDEFRTLPKAFVPYQAAQRLWEMRQGEATSVRFRADDGGAPDASRLEAALLAELPAADFGLAPLAVRADGLEASEGATDFGLYFLYFSWFLLVAAFVLIALLFRLGIERRLREIGLLLACGWPPKRVSRMLLFEVGIVAFVGVVAGSAAGLLYAAGMVRLLSGAWEGAVAGTFGGGGETLRLFVRWGSVTMGALGALEMAALAAWWTTRRLVRLPARGLLAGALPSSGSGAPGSAAPGARAPGSRSRRLAVLFGALAAGLLGATGLGLLPDAGGFFGAGSALLASALALAWSRLHKSGGRGIAGLRGLAFRASSFRPGRSLAAMALVAFAAFTLVAVESFRKRAEPGALPAGAGGILAMTETVLGVPWDPASEEGVEALNLPGDLGGFRVRPLRLAGHEDASCLNLYRPARPRVLGVPPELRAENRFAFAAHLGETPEERENPWRLFDRERSPSDPIPVVGDQNSMTYVLKWPVGEERSYPIGDGGAPVRLLLVATLWDSLFQGELLMAEEDLLASLPVEEGYRMFLVDRGDGAGLDGPAALAASEVEAAGLLDAALSDYGAQTTTARARLDGFHQVENTYLSTFQALGGLGLLLGTLGLGAVLLRNADERRKEWALLAASGYRARDFAAIGFWENALLLTAGVGAGAIAAFVSVLPVLGQRDADGSLGLLAALLVGILAFGLLTGALVARATANRPILPALRTE